MKLKSIFKISLVLTIVFGFNFAVQARTTLNKGMGKALFNEFKQEEIHKAPEQELRMDSDKILSASDIFEESRSYTREEKKHPSITNEIVVQATNNSQESDQTDEEENPFNEVNDETGNDLATAEDDIDTEYGFEYVEVAVITADQLNFGYGWSESTTDEDHVDSNIAYIRTKLHNMTSDILDFSLEGKKEYMSVVYLGLRGDIEEDATYVLEYRLNSVVFDAAAVAEIKNYTLSEITAYDLVEDMQDLHSPLIQVSPETEESKFAFTFRNMSDANIEGNLESIVLYKVVEK
jgi:hypothetical protein